MERLSENSLGSDAQRFNFQDSSSTGSTWFTRCLSGKKLASIIGIVLTIMLLFAVWLMVIQKENQSLRMELMELKNETKPLKMLVRNLQEMKRMTFVHDCKHLRYHGITQSGKYFIDPDGPEFSRNYHLHFNQPPLQVFCDFEKNYTVVPYDDEQDPTQMRRLISESRGSCWQDIDFDCKALKSVAFGFSKAWIQITGFKPAGSWYDGGNLLRSTDLSLLSFNLCSTFSSFLLINLMNFMISAQLRYLAGKWW